MNEYFKFYNANPKNKITQDCVIRALTIFLNKPYETILNDLIDVYKHTGWHIADPICFMYYLKRYYNIKKYDVDFTLYLNLLDLCKILETKDINKLMDITIQNKNRKLDILSNNIENIIVLLENTHLTFVQKNIIMDTWDCSNLKVTSYFLLPK